MISYSNIFVTIQHNLSYWQKRLLFSDDSIRDSKFNEWISDYNLGNGSDSGDVLSQ